MLDNPWQGLPKPEQGKLSIRRCPQYSVLDAHWARKPDGRIAVLLVLKDVANVPAELPTLRGLELLTVPAERQFQLILEPAGDWMMFRALTLDLLDAANEGGDEADSVARLLARLHRWQRFLSRSSARLLNEDEVRGLIGELLFLRDRLFPVVGVEAVDCWQGPGGLPQDFLHAGRVIEVKTYGAGTNPVIRIASAEQLTSVDVPLYLHVVCLVRMADAMTLPALVAEIRAMLVTSPACAAVFEDRLLEAGYIDLPAYRSQSYLATSTSDYRVADDFPRLTVRDLPLGVCRLGYSIQIDHIARFAVDAREVIGTVLGCKS